MKVQGLHPKIASGGATKTSLREMMCHGIMGLRTKIRFEG